MKKSTSTKKEIPKLINEKSSTPTKNLANMDQPQNITDDQAKKNITNIDIEIAGLLKEKERLLKIQGGRIVIKPPRINGPIGTIGTIGFPSPRIKGFTGTIDAIGIIGTIGTIGVPSPRIKGFTGTGAIGFPSPRTIGTIGFPPSAPSYEYLGKRKHNKKKDKT